MKATKQKLSQEEREDLEHFKRQRIEERTWKDIQADREREFGGVRQRPYKSAFLRAIQVTLTEPGLHWMYLRDVEKLEALKKEEAERERTRIEAEAALHREYTGKPVTEKVIEVVILTEFKAAPIKATKILDAETIIDALGEDCERLSEAAKKLRNRKKYLAEIKALFEAALERDISKRSTLEIIQADIQRLEKKLGIAAKEEAPEVEEPADKRMKYAEPIDKHVNFEAELRAKKKEEAIAREAWMAQFQRNTILIGGK